MDSSRSSIRVHHTQHAALTGALGKVGSHSPPVIAAARSEGRSPRFPKLDECAHFHYEHVELGTLQITVISDQDLSLGSRLHGDDVENQSFAVQVASQGKSWLLRRTYQNFRSLDTQLHRCIYDRKFSALPELPPEDNLSIPTGQDHEEAVQNILADYLNRFSLIAGNLINCGPVLSWFELDNRGRRLLVPDNDSCPINTPAVAAAYSVKRYSAQAQDEISFEVGDMISVIDMPPPEESVWWRGKRGFEVGFFPSDCVALIGDKVPRNLQLSAGSSAPNSPRDMMLACQPSKPVLRKHGKLISFFRSFILSRPSRRRLKQSGILKERVFGCDLGEHLLNSGHDIPMVLKCCSEFIETHGIVDGIYRLSGVTSNIQKLRNAFDEDRVPGLYEDEAILQDIHSVASLLKMYFRELPNPLCTYQLYHQFVGAVQNKDGLTRDGPDENRDGTRLMLMRDAVQKLPPPHYRTLQYLVKHLARVAEHGHQTGMTPRNVAIVWAPNLLRCKALEVGGVAALQGVGVQAVVTEFLICYADLIFCDRLPPLSIPMQQATPKRSRPKSLAISTPTKLLSLEEARTRALLSAAGKTDQDYIEVGGGPSSLPAKYHTVIDLPSRKRSGSKRSPLGWKSFFSKAGRSSSGGSTHSSRKAQQQQQQLKPQRKTSTPSAINFCTEKAVTEADVAPGRRRLRPVKSAESLASGNNSSRNSTALSHGSDAVGQSCLTPGGGSHPGSQAVSPSDGQSQPKAGHNRSVSHDSYFDHLAETPSMSRRASSRLHEEEGFSSSLDLSEIQLNFELEESEMRIFSEDETLLSTFDSASVMSQGSPHTHNSNVIPRDRHARNSVGVGKRLTPHGVPHLARPEDTLSGGCASLDPSPKKQKTSGNSNCDYTANILDSCKRSRLEEQLTNSSAELRYIDSQSPEQIPAQQQVLVHAEVHQSNNATNSSASSNGTYGVLASTSSSLAEAPTSDTESVTLLSSGLTTPDTPVQLYRPLREDGESSGSGVGSTPDYENVMTSASKLSPLEPKYEQLIATPSPSQDFRSYDNIPVPKPRFQTPRTPYENVQREFLAAELNASKVNEIELKDQHCTKSPYENLQREFIINSDLNQASSPPASSSPSLSAGTTAVRHLESSGDEDTLEISQDNFSLDLNAGFEHIYTEIMSGNETHAEDADSGTMMIEPCDTDQINEVSVNVYSEQSAPTLPVHNQNVYQNVPSVSQALHPGCRAEDDVYEDFAFENSIVDSDILQNSGHEAPLFDVKQLKTAPLDPNVVYQQVKYLRRSIHEVNALLEDSSNAEESLMPENEVEADQITQAGEALKHNFSSYGEVENESKVVAMQEKCPETHFDCSPIDTCYELDTVTNVSNSNQFPEVQAFEPAEDEIEMAAQEKCSDNESVQNVDLLFTSCDSENNLPPVKPFPPSVLPSHDSVSPQKTLEACVFPTLPPGVASLQEPAEASEFPIHCDKAANLGESLTSASDCASSQASPVLESPLPDSSLPDALNVATESRRRFESEIGRELVRERRMTQELQEVRATKTSPHGSPAHKPDQGNKSSVKELLSRFELTQMDLESSGLAPTSPLPLSSRKSDPHPKPSEKIDITSATLPPCLRARAARIARTKLNTSTNLSASLDEDHFLLSGGSKGEGRALIRTQTEPDVNTENRSVEENELTNSSSVSKAVENESAIFSQDDDPQRRERIERYKEERRSFLRKKYRSESFRNEQDDTLARLKQKAVCKGGLPGVSPVDMPKDITMDLDNIRQQKSNTSERLPVEKISSKDSSPVKSTSKTKSGRTVASPTSPEPITCVTVRQRIVTPDKVSLKGCESPLSPNSPRTEHKKFGFSPEKIPVSKGSPERKFPEKTRIPVSVDLAHVERRPAQLVLVQRSSLPVASSERRMSAGNKVSSPDSNFPISLSSSGDIKRRASVESNSSQRSPIKSPSYCIRDMAALFEAKENTSRSATSTTASKSTSSSSAKNFVSSV
ncbi:GTPase-activating protein CdGAPr isoform X2 [Frankliniella occidentalis]|nr:GTPase-activating protein CdGAPr isoform X2 [Frankliniella occidentalis]XP_026293572.1 GTPase-activating protein CdGAPr isoform X2 [Frankliniella occidentalis]